MWYYIESTDSEHINHIIIELKNENDDLKYQCGQLVRICQDLIIETKFLHIKTDCKESVLKELMFDIMKYVSKKFMYLNMKINFNKL